MECKMEMKIELAAVWIFSTLAFITMNGLVGFFAIIASVTTIVRNWPYVKPLIKKLIDKIKR